MKQVGILIYEQVQAVDLAGALDTFGQANEELKKLGRPAFYQIHLLGLNTQPVRAENGLKLMADVALNDCPALDYLVLPGGSGNQQLQQNPVFLHWLRSQDSQLEKLISICTGAFLLAASGLVNGKTLSTHWRFAQQLQDAFPAVQVNAEALYHKEDKYYSSGGMTAGIDLCLAILEEDLGLHLAQTVAQELVMYLRRSGNQTQYSRPLTVQASEETRFIQLQQWVLDNLHRPIGLAQMADKVCLSERHFRRIFTQRFGLSPSRYLEQLRLDRARSLLLCDGYSLERVCQECGFSGANSFGRLFKLRFGFTPMDYRVHFGG